MQTNYEAIDDAFYMEAEMGGRVCNYSRRTRKVWDSYQHMYSLLSEIQEVEAEPSC